MAAEGVVAGKIKQVKGKANDAAGAIRGDLAQQIKGNRSTEVPTQRRVLIGSAFASDGSAMFPFAFPGLLIAGKVPTEHVATKSGDVGRNGATDS